ncbi:hypothetical protein BH24BAC1_BH24BAC1_39020 [soil metagenome]|jgi:hypothetical protein
MKFKELLEIAAVEISDLIEHENADIRLEQVEYNEKNKEWEIVVSYLKENPNKNALASSILSVSRLPYERIYKKFEITEDKEIKSMKMFTP